MASWVSMIGLSADSWKLVFHSMIADASLSHSRTWLKIQLVQYFFFSSAYILHQQTEVVLLAALILLEVLQSAKQEIRIQP